MKIAFPADILPLIRHYADRKQEHFLCVSLNGANEIITTRVVSVGLVNKTQVHPREVFADPITDRAAAVILAHNHPSGSLIPSPEDITVTRQLKAAGETLGIRVLDHIIFNHTVYPKQGIHASPLVRSRRQTPGAVASHANASRRQLFEQLSS